MTELNEYIVGARNPASKEQDLQRFLDAINERDDATVASGDPTRHLVVHMAAAAVSAMTAQMGKEIIIEKNAPLRY